LQGPHHIRGELWEKGKLMWKIIEELPSYEISSLGQVRNIKTRKILKVVINKGYYRLHLWYNKKGYNRSLHRLIAIHFIPNPENKPEINHKDGNKLNNRIDNLEWCTSKENRRHAFDIGLQVGRSGEKHHNCKLTEKQILEIVELRKNGVSQKEVAKLYGVHKNHITRISCGTRWNSITGVRK